MAGAVAETYRHKPKQATPCPTFDCGGVAFKWYDIGRADAPVPRTVQSEARAFLLATLNDAGGVSVDEAGFIILHRCGDNFYFLLHQVWRGSNELWEAVYAKQGDAGFSAFSPAYPDPGHVRPTFCVWEMGVVAHEAAAWSWFLSSARRAADFDVWKTDLFTGAV